MKVRKKKKYYQQTYTLAQAENTKAVKRFINLLTAESSILK